MFPGDTTEHLLSQSPSNPLDDEGVSHLEVRKYRQEPGLTLTVNELYIDSTAHIIQHSTTTLLTLSLNTFL